MVKLYLEQLFVFRVKALAVVVVLLAETEVGEQTALVLSHRNVEHVGSVNQTVDAGESYQKRSSWWRQHIRTGSSCC